MKIDVNNYLIVGAGVSGLSLVEYLVDQGGNTRIMDTRELPPNSKRIKSLLPNTHISFGRMQQEWIEQADVILLSPGISPHEPEFQQAAACGTEVIGDIELFARNVTKPYIAITGSNGKSTVTMLVRDILASQGLRVQACANIGEPALNVINNEVDIFVLELSSFQLETCKSLAPLAAVVLNVSDDHLDRHESIEQYAEIKSSIYKDAAHKIMPRDKQALKYLSNYKSDLSFGIDIAQDENYGVIEDETGRWLVQGDRKIIQSSDLALLGSSGELNVLAALALTQSLIKDESKAVEAIKQFKGLPHRCELIIEHNNVKWIDDSKGTNVGATVSAIQGLGQSLILILGGVHKGGSLDDLCAAIKDRVSHVIVFGRDRQVFIDALREHVDIKEASSLQQCVDYAYQLAKPAQAVLFSPACASFDMFVNYIERGLAFKTAVLAKVNGESHG